MFPNVLLGPTKKTLWLSCGLGCDWGRGGLKDGHEAWLRVPLYGISALYFFRFPKTGPAHLSDGYTEAQSSEATSPKPHSKSETEPGVTHRSHDASALPTSQIPSQWGSGEHSLEGAPELTSH